MIFSFLNKKPEPVIKANAEKFTKILKLKVPEPAINYVLDLWLKHPFSFKMPKSRKTCLGNYRQQGSMHTVTVNADLNQYSFLITLIHEIAHQHVAVNKTIFKRNPEPHGREWKTTFSMLMNPLLIPEVFPEDILVVLSKHMKDPAASSMRDQKLVLALKKYDPKLEIAGFKLESLESGQKFLFNQKPYMKIENRRTRTLVECVKTKKRYTIPVFVEVSLI